MSIFTSNFLKSLLIIVAAFSFSAAKAQVSKNINFTDFSVTKQNDKISIDFKTDGANPTNYFEIQKSTDGVHFKTIAYILGPDPKKQGTCDCYGCFDKVEKNDIGHTYYRAKHISESGAEQISVTKLIAKS